MDTHAFSRKGQTAIEYLTTYGWAILAIVVVAAVLVQMGVFSQCNKATPRFAGQAASISTWAFTGTNSMSFIVRAANEDLTNVSVHLDADNDDAYDYGNESDVDISAGNTGEVLLSTGSEYSSGDCASGQLLIGYELEDISDRINSTGSGRLTGPVP